MYQEVVDRPQIPGVQDVRTNWDHVNRPEDES